MNHPQSKIKTQKSRPLPKEASGTQSSHSKKRKKSVTAKDKNPSQPSGSTDVVPKMHKEDLQAASVQTSLGGTTSTIIHSESASRPDALIDLTARADFGKTNLKILCLQNKSDRDGLGILQTEPDTKKESRTINWLETESDEDVQSSDDEIKLEDLTELVKGKNVEAMDLDSLKDDTRLLISSDNTVDIQEESQKFNLEKEQAEATLFKAQPSYPNAQQLIELLVKSLKPELLLTDQDFSTSILTELKELSSKVNEINRGNEGFKEMYGEGEQVRDKGKKAMSHKEDDEEESDSDSDTNTDVARSKIKKAKKDLIDIMGLDVVEKVYKDKVKYDKYCLNMLNKRDQGKITNRDVLSKGKGPISLKVYRYDGSE
ncbi:hypothetical protein Tco_0603336 [Tanacetum coccineum]